MIDSDDTLPTFELKRSRCWPAPRLKDTAKESWLTGIIWDIKMLFSCEAFQITFRISKSQKHLFVLLGFRDYFLFISTV